MEEVTMENDFQKIESQIRMNEYKALKYENKYFTLDEYKMLAKTLQENPTKDTLIMISIHIDSEGLKELSKLMTNNFQIKHLQISWSNFSQLHSEFQDFCVATILPKLFLITLRDSVTFCETRGWCKPTQNSKISSKKGLRIM